VLLVLCWYITLAVGKCISTNLSVSVCKHTNVSMLTVGIQARWHMRTLAVIVEYLIWPHKNCIALPQFLAFCLLALTGVTEAVE